MSDEQKKCSCGSSGKVMIYACSGGSNVGQLANEAAIELARSGKGSMGCLAGLAAHVPTMLHNAKAADMLLVIDGCGVKCAGKAIEQAGLTGFESVVITELGVKKNYELRGDRERLPELIKEISARLDALR